MMTEQSKRDEAPTRAFRFSGHETFPCRYAWLPKAAQAAAEKGNHDILTAAREADAMVELGVGNRDRYAKDEISVILVWHSTDAEGLKRARRLFTTVNRYGPVPRNDNMFDETIQRLVTKTGAEPILFQHPARVALFAHEARWAQVVNNRA